ncbi:LysM peptidoglycan-binding domain-containing protein [Roseovarius sp. 2305UL8-3]|uniref:LysM peptidoglycan-binding domain-containing protein n=1 Tax=Roseovarius conchicola TaxID=3121636 RepID=UPI003527E08A
MIRAAIVSLGFLCVTLVLIILQPTSEPTEQTLALADDSAVTRAETEFEAYDALADSLSLVTEGVENAAPEIEIEPVYAAVAPATPAAITPETDLATEPVSLTATPIPKDGLEQLVITALAQGQSNAYIEALVNDAAAKGKVEVPETLITEDGRVDTTSLLSILQKSGLEAGVDESYTVQPGDSLAAISYRFYGSTTQALDIYNANRGVLTSPNQLQAGLELMIPAL